MRRTTAWALGGVLAGTVLLGTGSTMATFRDTESFSVTAGAGSVELAVQPVARGKIQMTSGEPLTLTVDAFSTGASASLQLTAVDAPGSNACGPSSRSVTASVSADWLAEIHPIPLCDLLDHEHPVVLGQVDPTAPISGGALEIRVDGLAPGPHTTPQWGGSFTFRLVQGIDGFTAVQELSVHVVTRGAGRGEDQTAPVPSQTETAVVPTAEEPAAVPTTGEPSPAPPTSDESPADGGAAPVPGEEHPAPAAGEETAGSD